MIRHKKKRSLLKKRTFLESHQARSRVFKLQRMRSWVRALLQAPLHGGLQALSCQTCYKKPSKPKSGGNMNQAQYLEWFLRGWIWKYFTESQKDSQYTAFVLVEDNDGSHGTQSLKNPCRESKEHVKRNYGFG
ncbi:hypothetical protein B0A55_10851 [Friedmanniomyces simplex]|uniref:Uncharacterized protein n=1 Tax=Friedmanniomyces simplex TaxID=329884 RepID=A0A4U0X3S8_9PEZI|nr:hypothetical protein B0A55_10851 [Friedmanniomyces simplex]